MSMRPPDEHPNGGGYFADDVPTRPEHEAPATDERTSQKFRDDVPTPATDADGNDLDPHKDEDLDPHGIATTKEEM